LTDGQAKVSDTTPRTEETKNKNNKFQTCEEVFLSQDPSAIGNGVSRVIMSNTQGC